MGKVTKQENRMQTTSKLSLCDCEVAKALNWFHESHTNK